VPPPHNLHSVSKAAFIRSSAAARACARLLQPKARPTCSSGISRHGPFQNMRADLAGGLHGFAVSLTVKQLVFRLRHPRIAAEIDGKDPIEIKRSQLAGKTGVIPMMTIFLPGRILLRRDRVARERPLERAIPHGDLAAVTALDISSCAPQALRRR